LAGAYFTIATNKEGEDINVNTLTSNINVAELADAINSIDMNYFLTYTKEELTETLTKNETKWLQENIEDEQSGYPKIESLSKESKDKIHDFFKDYLDDWLLPSGLDNDELLNFQISIWQIFDWVNTDYSYFTRYASVYYGGATYDEDAREYMVKNAREQWKYYQMIKYWLAVAMYQEMISQWIDKENIIFDPDSGASYLTQRQQEWIAFQNEMRNHYIAEEVTGLFEDSEIKKSNDKVVNYFWNIDKAADIYYNTEELKVKFRSSHYPKYCEVQRKQARIYKKMNSSVDKKSIKAISTLPMLFSRIDAEVPLSDKETESLVEGVQSLQDNEVKWYFDEISWLVDTYGTTAYENMSKILSSDEVVQSMPSESDFKWYKKFWSKINEIQDLSYEDLQDKFIAKKAKSAPYGYYTKHDMIKDDKDHQKIYDWKSFMWEKPDNNSSELAKSNDYRNMSNLSQHLLTKEWFHSYAPTLSTVWSMKSNDILRREKSAKWLRNSSTVWYLASTVWTGISSGVFSIISWPYKAVKWLDLMFRTDKYKMQQQEDWYNGSFLWTFVENTSRPALFSQFWKTDEYWNQTNSVDLINLPGNVTKQLIDMILLLGWANLMTTKLTPWLVSMWVEPALATTFSSFISTTNSGAYLHFWDHLEEARHAGLTWTAWLSHACFATVVESAIESAGWFTATNFLKDEAIKQMAKKKVKERLLAFWWTVWAEVSEEIVNQVIMDTNNSLLNDNFKTSFNITWYKGYIELVVLTALTTGILAWWGNSKLNNYLSNDKQKKTAMDVLVSFNKFEADWWILSSAQKEMKDVLQEHLYNGNNESWVTFNPEDLTWITEKTFQEEIYPANERAENKRKIFEQAFSNMDIEQSSERNELAFDALMQSESTKEFSVFLERNKASILIIIEHAHNNRNDRDESKSPLWIDSKNPDNKIFPMKEAHFLAEKKYIISEIWKLPWADLTIARKVMILLMKEWWCGKNYISKNELLSWLRNIWQYRDSAQEQDIKDYYNLIDKDKWLTSLEDFNFEALAELDDALTKYFVYLMETTYGDDYKTQPLWKLWDWSMYELSNRWKWKERIQKLIFEMILWNESSINQIWDALQNIAQDNKTEESAETTEVEENSDILSELALMWVKINELSWTIFTTKPSELETWSWRWFESAPWYVYPKVRALLQILKDLNVDMSTVTLDIGENTTEMVRNQSYMAFYIPKLNRSVFVTNEYWESTFVFEWKVSEEVFTNFTKDETLFLAATKDMLGKKINFTPKDVPGWIEKIKHYLTEWELWELKLTNENNAEVKTNSELETLWNMMESEEQIEYSYTINNREYSINWTFMDSLSNPKKYNSYIKKWNIKYPEKKMKKSFRWLLWEFIDISSTEIVSLGQKSIFVISVLKKSKQEKRKLTFEEAKTLSKEIDDIEKQGNHKILATLWKIIEGNEQLSYSYKINNKEIKKYESLKDTLSNWKKYSAYVKVWNNKYPNQKIPNTIQSLLTLLINGSRSEIQALGEKWDFVIAIIKKSKEKQSSLTIDEAIILYKHIDTLETQNNLELVVEIWNIIENEEKIDYTFKRNRKLFSENWGLKNAISSIAKYVGFVKVWNVKYPENKIPKSLSWLLWKLIDASKSDVDPLSKKWEFIILLIEKMIEKQRKLTLKEAKLLDNSFDELELINNQKSLITITNIFEKNEHIDYTYRRNNKESNIQWSLKDSLTLSYKYTAYCRVWNRNNPKKQLPKSIGWLLLTLIDASHAEILNLGTRWAFLLAVIEKTKEQQRRLTIDEAKILSKNIDVLKKQTVLESLSNIWNVVESETQINYSYEGHNKEYKITGSFKDSLSNATKYVRFSKAWNINNTKKQLPKSVGWLLSTLIDASHAEILNLGTKWAFLLAVIEKTKEKQWQLTLQEAQVIAESLKNGNTSENIEDNQTELQKASIESFKNENRYLIWKQSFVEDVVLWSYDSAIYELIENRNKGLEIEKEMVDIFLYLIKPINLNSIDALFSYVASINNEFSLALSQEQIDIVIDEIWKWKENIKFDNSKLKEYNERVSKFNEKRKDKSPSLVDISKRFPQIRKFDHSFDQCAAQGVFEFSVVSYWVDWIIISWSKWKDFSIQNLCIKIARNDNGLSAEIENHLLIQKINKELNNSLLVVPTLIWSLSDSDHIIMQYLRWTSLKWYLILNEYKDKLQNLKSTIDENRDHPMIKAIYDRITKYNYTTDKDILRNLSESDIKNILLLQWVTESEFATFQMPTSWNRKKDFVDAIKYLNERDGLDLSPEMYHNAYEWFINLLKSKWITDIDSHLWNIMIFKDNETQEFKLWLIDFGKISFDWNSDVERKDLLDQYNIKN